MLPTLPPFPKHRESPPAPPVGVGRARCGGGDASSPSPRHRLPPPNPPSRPPPLRRRPGDRGFRLLLCRWGGNSLQPWSPGQADSHRGQHRLPPLAHPRGSPRRRGRGSRRGRPASRGSRSSHAGCSSPHINSYCSGGRAPSGSSSGSGNDGDPLLGSPILAPAPQPLTCPPGGDPEPLGDRPRRARPAASVRSAAGVPSPRPVSPRLAAGARGDRGPLAEAAPGGSGRRGRAPGAGKGGEGREARPCRRLPTPSPGKRLPTKWRSGAGLIVRRGRGGGGRGRSQVAQPARRGQEIPERRSQSGPACPGTGHRASSSRRRPVLAGQGSSWGAPGTHGPGGGERGLEGLW
ncbi:collagen alpha-1(I) chain-like [Onychostruthus taczanowskii]|uniref:collagen alpha-1(I) chain-like n=1 Tax=Onychostruthus taczanowskii TaxID=356909 RepID=UPI001B80A741|nr:collagen alpha-1(I) chain-like [Onychostruthus taczanowskii]